MPEDLWNSEAEREEHVRSLISCINQEANEVAALLGVPTWYGYDILAVIHRQAGLCDEWKEMIIAKASGELSDAECITLDKHLQDCPSCVEEAKAFERLAAQLHGLSKVLQEPLSAKVLAYKQRIARRGEGVTE